MCKNYKLFRMSCLHACAKVQMGVQDEAKILGIPGIAKGYDGLLMRTLRPCRCLFAGQD